MVTVALLVWAGDAAAHEELVLDLRRVNLREVAAAMEAHVGRRIGYEPDVAPALEAEELTVLAAGTFGAEEAHRLLRGILESGGFELAEAPDGPLEIGIYDTLLHQAYVLKLRLVLARMLDPPRRERLRQEGLGTVALQVGDWTVILRGASLDAGGADDLLGAVTELARSVASGEVAGDGERLLSLDLNNLDSLELLNGASHILQTCIVYDPALVPALHLRSATIRGPPASLDALRPVFEAGMRASGVSLAVEDEGRVRVAVSPIDPDPVADAPPPRVDAAIEGEAEERILVRRVSPDSTSAKLGIRPGDRIVALDGAPLSGGAVFDFLRASAPGTRHSIELDRDGEPVELAVPHGAVELLLRELDAGLPDPSTQFEGYSNACERS